MRTGNSRLSHKREGVSSSAPKLWSLFSPIQRACMPIRSNNKAGAAGPRGERTGRGEPRRREGRRGQALAKLCVSARQLGIRQRASVRMKQSKSQRIVANADATSWLGHVFLGFSHGAACTQALDAISVKPQLLEDLIGVLAEPGRAPRRHLGDTMHLDWAAD